jgi:hypothetical protein
VRIFEEEMEVGIDMHVNDDWSVVNNVMVQVLEVFLGIA